MVYKVNCPDCGAEMRIMKPIIEGPTVKLVIECSACKKVITHEAPIVIGTACKKILALIDRVTKIKIEASQELEKINNELNRAFTLLRDCASSNHSHTYTYYGPQAQRPRTRLGYTVILTCDDHVTRAEEKSESAAHLLNYLKEINDELINLRNFIITNCQNSGLSNTSKEELTGRLTLLRQDTEPAVNQIDNILNEIRNELQDYVHCVQDTSKS